MNTIHRNDSQRSALIGAAIVVLVILAALWITRRPYDEPHTAAAMPAPAHEAPAPAALDSSHAPAVAVERTPLAAAPADRVPPRARPHGVVRETGTHAPLPEYRLGVYSFADAARGTFEVVSGARGEFDSATAVPAGKLRFEYIDDRGLAFRNSEYFTLEFAPSAADVAPPIELFVPTGPTYFIDVALPAGARANDFDVQLLRARPFQSSPHPQPPIHAALRAPSSAMDAPSLPWVRFGEPPSWAGLGWLELRSNDGRWRGGNWVERLASTAPEPVHVVLESATWLVARVESDPGAEDFSARFRLDERVAPGESRTPRVHGGFCARNELRIDFLEPGEYHLSARDAFWSPFERDVTIVQGENDIGTITLEPRPVVGSIGGVIESRSGRYEGACHVSLSRTAFDHDAFFDHSIDFEDDGTGKLVARFELEDVTAGEWFLYVHCHDGFTHTNSLMTVSAPKDDVHIVLDDASVTIDLELRDAETGELLGAESGVDWNCGDAFDGTRGSHVELTAMPDAAERFTFVASAPGYQPQRGTAADLERTPANATSPALLHRVCKLERGFGGLFQVRDRASRSPIAGAEILLDDVQVGTTDARGEFWFTSAETPARCRVQKPGWRWVPTSDADAATGKLGDGPEFYVEMVQVE
jgi:hypothetical protein